jgi:redox-sensitive bicupin YhaK (pirin superfamily)
MARGGVDRVGGAMGTIGPAADPPRVDVRRAAARARTTAGGIESRHSFAFGAHYDPDNTHFGLLLAVNEDVIAPGAGYDTHPHRDVEILTWVLAGELVHRDSAGRTAVARPGLVQRLSAGAGVQHSERNDDHDRAVHLVQMWVQPDTDGGEPDYARLDLGRELDTGRSVVVASGTGRPADGSALRIRQRHAALHAARLRPGGTVDLPASPAAHLHVVRGAVRLEGTGVLGTGDAARITGADGQRVTAGPDGAEVLVWEMHAALTRPG